MASATPSQPPSLRALQKPLKDTYRASPQSALVTLTSTGTLDPSTPHTCSLSPSTSAAAKRLAGLHSAAGGAGFDASGELCSGDILLESLVACYGVTLRAVADAMGMSIRGGGVVVSGELDFRGTLGVKDANGESVEVGFRRVEVGVRLDVGDEEGLSGEEKEAKVRKLLELSERYCVVLQTIRRGVSGGVQVKLGHLGSEAPDARGDGEEHANGDGGKGEGMEEKVGDEEVLRLN